MHGSSLGARPYRHSRKSVMLVEISSKHLLIKTSIEDRRGMRVGIKSTNNN
jgi:hypothetical protein